MLYRAMAVVFFTSLALVGTVAWLAGEPAGARVLVVGALCAVFIGTGG